MKTKSIRRFNAVILILLIAIAFMGCSSKENNDTIKEDLISFMEVTQAKMQSPGWLTAIKTPTLNYELAGGEANVLNHSEIQTTDIIRIGSITKIFTATLALILCDEGSLNLSDKLSNYYPEFPNSNEITIEHLLKHTSGIVTWDENDSIRQEIFNGTGNWTIDKLINWAAQQTLISEPGTEFHYSNIGYFLIGKIIEHKSNSTIEVLIDEKICTRLNLNNTFMADTYDVVGERIHGYDGSTGTIEDMTGTVQAKAINFELAWTAGGMLSTIQDLTVWVRAVSNGILLSDSLHIKQMPVLNPPTEHSPYWSGYGMGISQTDVWLGHTGAVSGYVCNMSYYPEKDVSIITFFNKFSAFDVDENTKDITAVAENFLKTARYLCPETLHTNSK